LKSREGRKRRTLRVPGQTSGKQTPPANESRQNRKLKII